MPSLRPRLRFANVISVIALFVALGGGAYAATKLKSNQVKSKHIARDAVQGIDALESSFDTVPKASNADNAANAANAANANTLDGNDSLDFVSGAGVQFGGAEIVATGDPSALELPDGTLNLACNNNPALTWDDASGEVFPTDIWVDEGVDDGVAEVTHLEVANGAAPVALGPNLPATRSVGLEIWDGEDLVTTAKVSVFWDAGDQECTVAYFVHIEPNAF